MLSEQIEILRNWNGYPVRAIQWAIMRFPMKVGRNAREAITYTLHTNDADQNKKSYHSILIANKDEYWQFLKDNKIEPNLYDRTFANYKTWLEK